MPTLKRCMLAACATICLSAMLTSAASAAFHSDAVNATGACNGALPSFEGAIRKRPTGILNQGTTSAFVSCSVTTDGGMNPGYDTAIVYLVNRGTSSAAVDCTFVNGIAAELSPMVPTQFYPKTVGIPAGEAVAVSWEASEFELEKFLNIVNFSCNLPPKVEIALVGATYETVDPI